MTTSPVQLSRGDASVTVDPAAGGRVTSFVVDGTELMVQHGSDVFHWGSFPMAPWVGRLRNGRLEFDGRVVDLPVNAPPHALHGLATERPWSVTSADDRSVSLALELGHAADDPWPWPCRVTQSVSLDEGIVRFDLAVHAQCPMPADIGWHPWFIREISSAGRTIAAELDVAGGRIYLNDAHGIPTGELGTPPPRPWDYCFVDLKRSPTVRWPGELEVTVESGCDHWVFYDMEPSGICLEPWTGPPNSLNRLEPTIVTPERPLEASMHWTWRRLDG